MLEAKVIPALREDIATFNRWLGLTKSSISAELLMFIIWAATRSYADFGAQMQLVLGRKTLSDEFFAEAEVTLSNLVLSALASRANGHASWPARPGLPPSAS